MKYGDFTGLAEDYAKYRPSYSKFGGANSHMAIRAGEMAIPAAIGCGEVRFQAWSKAWVRKRLA